MEFTTVVTEMSSRIIWTASIGVVIGVLLWRYTRSSKKVDYSCMEWQRVGQVSKLLVYPIKSCRGSSIGSADCDKLGLKYAEIKDRSFMVTDEGGNFLTGRKYPKMVLLSLSASPEGLRMEAPGMSPLILSLPDKATAKKRKCRVWNDSVDGLDCGEEAAKWLSQYILGVSDGVRLVYYPHTTSQRPCSLPGFPLLHQSDGSAFADLTSFMLLSEASIDELNSRLHKEVAVGNFRPNIVVSGCEAFEEDTWRYLKIGQCHFRNVKPCTRCLFTTVDCETGEKDPDMEPLKTLESYRVSANPALRGRPLFGTNLGLDTPGQISVGDDVYVARQ